jgi:hypothetical protein
MTNDYSKRSCQVRQFLKKAFPDNSKTDKQLSKLLKRTGTVDELPFELRVDLKEGDEEE